VVGALDDAVSAGEDEGDGGSVELLVGPVVASIESTTSDGSDEISDPEQEVAATAQTTASAMNLRTRVRPAPRAAKGDIGIRFDMM
jgi:hypothetical protein